MRNWKKMWNKLEKNSENLEFLEMEKYRGKSAKFEEIWTCDKCENLNKL